MATVHAVIACAVIVAILLRRRRRNRRNRRVWTRQWIRRQDFDAYHHLMQELRISDTTSYRNFLRMDAPTFRELLGLVGPLITYKDTVMWQAISPGERLALTLRFLATGE